MEEDGQPPIQRKKTILEVERSLTQRSHKDFLVEVEKVIRDEYDRPLESDGAQNLASEGQ